jgi:RsbT co-antagonist protein rsbRD N-terminal domain
MATETKYIADYLEQHTDEILGRWRTAAKAESSQAERLSKMDDRELLDHLPAVTQALIGALGGEEGSPLEDEARPWSSAPARRLWRHGCALGAHNLQACFSGGIG